MQSSEVAAATKVQTSSGGLPMPFARVKQQPPPPTSANAMQTPLSTNLPPPKMPPTDIIASATPPTELAEAITDEVTEVSLDSTMNIFKSALDELSLDVSKHDEIEKRIAILKEQWLNDRIDKRLQQRLSRIAECLFSFYDVLFE